MHTNPLIGPVVVLVAWTLVMLVWMAVRRLSAARKAGLAMPDGTRGQDLDRQLPLGTGWPGQNYEHLMEQPTIFYAIVFALVVMGFDAPINVGLAWGYVGLRILHSLVQATYNRVAHRFTLFLLGSLCLFALTIHAALVLIHHG
jgi:hypothetical protein